MNNCMRRSLFAAFSALWYGGALWGASGIASRWDGLCGEKLKCAVSSDCHPQQYVTHYLDEDGVWHIMQLSDADAGGDGYLNRFSVDKLAFGPSLVEGPDAVTVNVVHPWWWELSGDERTQVGTDLYNLWPAVSGTSGIKDEYPPGVVSTPVWSNGTWSVGRGMFNGMERTMWQPPRGYEGDVARILFYLFTVYSGNRQLFGGFGSCYMSAQDYPGFSEAAIRQLLVWHRADVPDDCERQRNEVFAQYQGNINPFVEYPELAEHVWGDKKDEGLSGIDRPKDDGDDDEKDLDSSPLRARYSVAESRINLKSAFVPANAVWSVDGSRVEAEFLEPVALGIGVHELRFESVDCQGKVLIEITP